ncbi:MAG: trimeric intracellular cation channel family protein [Eubacteriales bacterium]|nr:trimeric intracellular cation channel family protein [Faecalibacterium sp.]MDD7570365.1 trimeric intracellular cation channel family protein [Faecalibacterium sp.]MDY6151420.1 trimeric intracellular cation channel family protein [Eubacteriales bacterium]
MDGIVFCLEIIGTVAFAFSGAMVGIRKKFDLFGILMMGIITSVGGGVTRDVILNVSPPVMFEHPTYCIVAAVSSMLMFFPFVRKFLDNKFVHGMIFVAVDSLGLAAFTVAAVMYCFNIGVTNLFLIVTVSCISGVGGGLLRDVIAGDRPYIFTKHVYAIAAFVGASVAVGVYELTGKEWATVIGFIVIIAIRYVAVKYHLNFPTIEDKKE